MTESYYEEYLPAGPEFGSDCNESNEPYDDEYDSEIFGQDVLDRLEEILECKEFYVCNAKDFDNFVVWIKTNHPRIFSKMKKHANFKILPLKID